MTRLALGVTLVGLLGLAIAPAQAQKGPAGREAPPEEERTARMMTMMGQMQEEMKAMRGEMRGMQNMGPMQGRMGTMMGQSIEKLGQMQGLMQQHREQMMKQCPGLAGPQPPKQGG